MLSLFTLSAKQQKRCKRDGELADNVGDLDRPVHFRIFKIGTDAYQAKKHKKADGKGIKNDRENRTASGGSVFLTCGTLTGAGNVFARGGRYTSNYGGGGGRIAVVQTVAKDFSAYTGTLDAGSYYCGPGTVFTRSAADGGEVSVYNATWFSHGRTDLPMTADGDAAKVYRDVGLVVTSNATVCLLADMTVYDLDLKSTTSKIDLNGHTLTVRSSAHKKGKGWGDAYEKLVTESGGKIVWKGGMALIIR